jgi:hypothetical protein
MINTQKNKQFLNLIGIIASILASTLSTQQALKSAQPTSSEKTPWWKKTDPGSHYITDKQGRTILSVCRIDGAHPLRKKERIRHLKRPDMKPGDHRGHGCPENLVDDPDRVNTQYNITAQSADTNLRSKRTVENLAKKIKGENPNSKIFFVTEYLYKGEGKRPVAETHSIMNDKGEKLYEVTLFNKSREEPHTIPDQGGTSIFRIDDKVLPGNDKAASSSKAAKSALGGIDFSTLELRYISEDSSLLKDGNIKYSFDAKPTAGNKNISDKSIAAVQASDAFFVWLSLSPNKFWVNLNPNEPNRVIDPQLAKTDAGRILLQSDLQMKKTVAKLTHPDILSGKQYWKQLESISYQQSNSSFMCPPVFRMWIVPAPATVREDGNGMYIADAPLDVKLEAMKDAKSKLLASSTLEASGFGSCTPASEKLETLYESLQRRLILPQIVRAVNTAPEYAELRRVYRSRVAAEWYRQRSASKATAYANLIDSEDVSSWPARQNWSSRQVFNQYVKSFTKGEYQVVRKWRQGDMMLYGQVSYGGVDFSRILFKQLNAKDFQKKWGNLEQVTDDSMKSPAADHDGKIWLGGSTTTGKATISSRSAWRMIWFCLGLGFLMLPFLIRWRRSQQKRLV